MTTDELGIHIFTESVDNTMTKLALEELAPDVPSLRGLRMLSNQQKHQNGMLLTKKKYTVKLQHLTEKSTAISATREAIQVTSVGAHAPTVENITIEVKSAVIKMLLRKNLRKAQVRHKTTKKNRGRRRKPRKPLTKMREERQKKKNWKIPMYLKKNLQKRRYTETKW